MKTGRLSFVTLAVLIVTALSAAVASAQESVQQGKSADLILPTNATGNYETGFKQVDIHKEGQTDNKNSYQIVEPQPEQEPQRKQRREQPQPYHNEVMPVQAGATPVSAPPPKELPKSGGSSAASLFSLGAGALLVAGGLMVRMLIR